VKESSLIERAWRVLRRDGIRSFWARFMGVCGYRRLFLLSRTLDELPAPMSARIPVVMEWMKPEDVVDYRTLISQAKDWPQPPQLRENDRCLTARVDGRLVAAMRATVGSGRISYLDLDLPMTDQEAYMFAAYTDPEFRGHAIAPAMSIELLRRLHESGVRRAIRATWPENTAALRAHAKAGFHPYALVGYMALGKWRRRFWREIRHE
jgi:RimJ/RimL family protein N-acetyltransferase